MDHREKRELREHKRRVKQAGNQRVRRQVRRALAEAPEDAVDLEPSYGRYRSAELNGLDRPPAPPVDDEADRGPRPHSAL